MRSNVESAIYQGTVRHRRFSPIARNFRHRVTYFYLDLAEVPARFRLRGIFSDRAPSLFGFRRKKYLGPSHLPLDEAVRLRVEAETGRRPRGPIRMLTQISSFGLTFNPVTFYYCFDETGAIVTEIVAEITNTPWNERHAYVLVAEDGPTHEFPKRFHVSPFLGMDYRYRWRFSPPSELLSVHMENLASEAGEGTPSAFDATLTLKRRPWSPRNLVLALVGRPFATGTILFLIYLHALILWSRRIPFFEHPKSRSAGDPK